MFPRSLFITFALLALPAPALAQAMPLQIEGRLDSSSETSDDGSYVNAHTFEGTAGETVAIELESAEFDAYLMLNDPQNKRIDDDDDGGRGKNALIVVTLPATGTYRVLANSYGAAAVGAYRLSIRPATSADIAVAEVEKLYKEGRQQENTNFQAALEAFQAALRHYQEAGYRAEESSTLNGIGGAYDDLGEYDQALNYYQQALLIRRELRDRSGEGQTLNNIGLVYANLGQPERALDYYQQALPIHQEVKDRSTEGTTLNNIGIVYANLGQPERALDYYQQALLIRQEVKDRPGEGTTLSNIGLVYANLGQPERALDYYQQALLICQEVKDRSGEGTTLNNIGAVYDSLGQRERALDYYQQALSIRQEVKDRSGEGQTLSNIGLVYDDLGQRERALDYYQQALLIRQEVKDRSGEATTLHNIAFLLTAKQPELAILFYKQSVNVYEQIRQDSRGLPRESQQAYIDSKADTYRYLANLLLQQDRVLEAQRVLDLLKVQELDDYLKNVRGTPDSQAGVEVLRPEQAILSRYNELQKTAIQLSQELSDLNASSSLTPAQEQRRIQLDELRTALNAQFNDFANSREIAELLAQLKPAVLRQTVDLAELAGLQNNLKDLNAALFYPLILEDRLELVITTPTSAPLRRTVNVSRQDLNAAIVEFRQALQDPRIDAKPAAQKLYQWLIEPIQADLQQANVTTIIYSPDGQLRYLPLAALYDPNQQQWLAQQYRINNITAKSLTELTAQPATAPRVLAAAFADQSISYSVPVDQNTVSYAGLPFAGKEVNQLSRLLPNTVSLLDRAFSLAAVMPEFARFNILHFATHAAFVPGDATQSFILFGNGDRPTLRDVESWTLSNIDLVVLSACETGLGGNYGNGEEILGLGYQFQLRGAKAVIASLWSVNDGGTQILMNAFYTALEHGMTKAQALQRAQIALITGDMAAVGGARGDATVAIISNQTGLPATVSDNLDHPYYWAPFILIGNGL